MVKKAIKRAFEKAKKKKWNQIYLMVDVHETIIKPNYSSEVLPKSFYPLAKEVLQYLTQRDDVVLILYTCSWPKEIEEYIELFKENDIIFSYSNENPEVKEVENKYGCYVDKPYYDVILDDKAGFDWRTDWFSVLAAFAREEVLCEKDHGDDQGLFDMKRASKWLKTVTKVA